MLPRITPSSNITSRNLLVRQGRVTAACNNKHSQSRPVVVTASSRLVLTPTGNGSWEHIGDKVPLPEPIPLKQGVFEVGRTEPADILLKIPTVSNRHALLRVEDDKISITDLNSTNGTVVNGHELTPMDNMEVSVGSEVIFGDMYLAKFTVDQVLDSHDEEEGMTHTLQDPGRSFQQQGTLQTNWQQ